LDLEDENQAYKVVDRLSVYSEAAGAVGHETLPLGRTNFEKGLSTQICMGVIVVMYLFHIG